MKLIAYQNGDRRIMAKVLDNKALPFASLEEFWADPQQSLLAAAQARSDGEPIANLVQIPPLPDTARVLCAGLNYAAHAQEAHFKVPELPDILGGGVPPGRRWSIRSHPTVRRLLRLGR